MTKINTKVSNALAVENAVSVWYSSHQYGPSFRDLASITGLSLGTVYSVCHELRDADILEFLDGVARTIKLKEKR